MFREYLRTGLIASACLASISCVSRAPTDCELDKRSGLYPSSYCDNEGVGAASGAPVLVQDARLASLSLPSKPTAIPVREQPVVAKIWVTDQALEGGHWMQGTWMFVEIEPSRWAGESIPVARAGRGRLGGRRASTRSRAFNPVRTTGTTIEAGEPAPRSEWGGRQ